jgi:hypothetical protein
MVSSVRLLSMLMTVWLLSMPMTVRLRSMLMTVVLMSLMTDSSFSCSVDGYHESRVFSEKHSGRRTSSAQKP